MPGCSLRSDRTDFRGICGWTLHVLRHSCLHLALKCCSFSEQQLVLGKLLNTVKWSNFCVISHMWEDQPITVTEVPAKYLTKNWLVKGWIIDLFLMHKFIGERSYSSAIKQMSKGERIHVIILWWGACQGSIIKNSFYLQQGFPALSMIHWLSQGFPWVNPIRWSHHPPYQGACLGMNFHSIPSLPKESTSLLDDINSRNSSAAER